jgi:hypothetical protein
LAYIQPVQTDQVDLPTAGYWVRLKKKATYGDQLAAQSAMLKLEQGSAGVISQMEWGAYIQALTVSMVVEWNVDDESGQILPISAASLNQLSAEDGQFLANEVASRAKTREAEQERPFVVPLSIS